MTDKMDKIKFLEEKATEVRQNIITMIYEAQSGHPGGSLSIADVITALYYDELNIDPSDPKWSERDRVVLSKGHCCPVLYAVLAMKGYFDFEIIHTLRKIGSILQGHPDMRKVPGIDMTTGSLGQGISAGVGMAFGLKKDGLKSRVYIILGDGEMQEGQVWEAAMLAAKCKLDNIVTIVDYNNLQIDGPCSEIMPIEPVDKKWESFGWKVIKIDGHKMEQILEAFAQARAINDQPVCIIAKTIKGKGVSYMENQCDWHGTAPDKVQYEIAMQELRGGG